MKYSMDVIGLIPTTPGQLKCMLALTVLLLKAGWSSAFSEVKEEYAESFVWRNIICKYGIPKEIITDNRSQFIAKKFKNFYSTWYPQGNRQAEVTNKTIMNNLKKKLEARKGKWVEEFPAVLWAYHTTLRKATGESPYSLVCSSEVIIPAEVGMARLRTEIA